MEAGGGVAYDDSLLKDLYKFSLQCAAEQAAPVEQPVPEPCKKPAGRPKKCKDENKYVEVLPPTPKIDPAAVVASIRPPWQVVMSRGRQIFRGYISVVCPEGHRHVYTIESAGEWCKTCQVVGRLSDRGRAIVADFGKMVACTDEMSAVIDSIGRPRKTAVTFCSPTGDRFLHIDCTRYAHWPSERRADNFYADTKKKCDQWTLVGARKRGRAVDLGL